jgi:hypothetical protein
MSGQCYAGAADGHYCGSRRAGASEGGESSAAAYGCEIHAACDYGPGFEKEFKLESGQRADAVNLGSREVVELKPNNPRAIRLGMRKV